MSRLIIVFTESKNKYVLVLSYMDYSDIVKQKIRELCRYYHIKRTRIINGVGVLVSYGELNYSIQHFENKFSVPYELTLERLIKENHD